MGAPECFVDVFPIENDDISASYVSLLEGYPNILGYTLPETNSSHLKHLGLEDEFPFGKASWQVRTVSFGECTSISDR